MVRDVVETLVTSRPDLVVADLASLGHDVDTPADLAALRSLLAARRGGAHSRSMLDRLAVSLEAAGRP